MKQENEEIAKYYAEKILSEINNICNKIDNGEKITFYDALAIMSFKHLKNNKNRIRKMNHERIKKKRKK